MDTKIGFIGCGNMGGALVTAVSNAGFSANTFISDFSEERTKVVSTQTEATISDSITISKECDFIFIGVKPQVIGDCFKNIKEYLKENKNAIIISMAAGVSVKDIKKMSGCSKIIRIMPNLPVALGKGVVLACAENISDDEKNCFEKILSASGVFDWIDEKFIDAASAVSGCGPAFVYMFIEAMADGAVSCGLPRSKAQLYAAGMVSGAAEMVLNSNKHPGQLKDEVCSPGGSTIAGVKALEDGAFRANAMNAVIKAYEKTKELGK